MLANNFGAGLRIQIVMYILAIALVIGEKITGLPAYR